MDKKPYVAPKLTAVRLEIRNAILAACHSSPNLTPKNAPFFNCKQATGCYNP